MTIEVSKKELDRRVTALCDMCRERGLRMTRQRLEIFREVARTGEHPDAEAIFSRVRSRLPSVSLDTVYRNLGQLEQMGVLSRVDPFCGRARFDANPAPHHHFVCVRCKKVQDVYLTGQESLAAPRQTRELGEVASLHLQVRGVCNACRVETENKG